MARSRDISEATRHWNETTMPLLRTFRADPTRANAERARAGLDDYRRAFLDQYLDPAEDAEAAPPAGRARAA